LVYYGKCWFTFPVVPGVDGYAVFGTVVMIPSFAGGPSVIKYPADFEFTLWGNEGGIPKNL
jgi:hypothetical protein